MQEQNDKADFEQSETEVSIEENDSSIEQNTISSDAEIASNVSDEPLNFQEYANVEVEVVSAETAAQNNKPAKKKKIGWRAVIAAILIVPIISLSLIGMFTDLFKRGSNDESNTSNNTSNQQTLTGNFFVQLVYNLPEPFNAMHADSVLQIVSRAKGFTVPTIADEILNKYFLGWYDGNTKATGTLVEEVGKRIDLFAKWDTDALFESYYTKGLKFTKVQNEYVVDGLEEGASASRIYIPKVYDGLPVTEISAGAFKNKSISEVYILGGYRIDKSENYSIKICDNAFEGSSVSKINLNVTNSIGEGAFKNCAGLKVDLSRNSVLTEIGDEAFWGTGDVDTFTIPASVTSLGNNLFGSVKVKKFDNKAQSDNFKVAEDGALYKKDGSSWSIEKCPSTLKKEYFVVKNDVNKIAPYAFAGCDAKCVYISQNGIIIEEFAFQGSDTIVMINVLNGNYTNNDNIQNLCVLDNSNFNLNAMGDVTPEDVVIRSKNKDNLTEGLYLAEFENFGQKYYFFVVVVEGESGLEIDYENTKVITEEIAKLAREVE